MIVPVDENTEKKLAQFESEAGIQLQALEILIGADIEASNHANLSKITGPYATSLRDGMSRISRIKNSSKKIEVDVLQNLAVGTKEEAQKELSQMESFVKKAPQKEFGTSSKKDLLKELTYVGKLSNLGRYVLIQKVTEQLTVSSIARFSDDKALTEEYRAICEAFQQFEKNGNLQRNTSKYNQNSYDYALAFLRNNINFLLENNRLNQNDGKYSFSKNSDRFKIIDTVYYAVKDYEKAQKKIIEEEKRAKEEAILEAQTVEKSIPAEPPKVLDEKEKNPSSKQEEPMVTSSEVVQEEPVTEAAVSDEENLEVSVQEVTSSNGIVDTESFESNSEVETDLKDVKSSLNNENTYSEPNIEKGTNPEFEEGMEHFGKNPSPKIKGVKMSSSSSSTNVSLPTSAVKEYLKNGKLSPCTSIEDYKSKYGDPDDKMDLNILSKLPSSLVAVYESEQKHEYEAAKRVIKAANDSYTNMVNGIGDVIKPFETELLQVRMANSQMIDKNKKLKSELDTSKKKASQLEKDNKIGAQTIENLENEKKQLQTDKEKLTKERDQYQSISMKQEEELLTANELIGQYQSLGLNEFLKFDLETIETLLKMATILPTKNRQKSEATTTGSMKK